MSQYLVVPLPNQRVIYFTKAELFDPVYGAALQHWLRARGHYDRRLKFLEVEFFIFLAVAVYSLDISQGATLLAVIIGHLLSFALCVLTHWSHCGLWEAEEAVWQAVIKVY